MIEIKNIVTDKLFIILNNKHHLFKKFRDDEHLEKHLENYANKNCIVYKKQNVTPSLEVVSAFGFYPKISCAIIISNQLELFENIN